MKVATSLQCIALVSTFTLGAAACAKSTHQMKADVPCQVAEAFIQLHAEWANENQLVVEGGEGNNGMVTLALSSPDLRWIRPELANEQVVSVEAPPASLLAAARTRKLGDAFAACPKARAAFSVLKASQAQQLGAIKGVHETSYQISLPLVIRDDAVLVMGSQSGPLAGGGAMYHLRRNADGHWIELGFAPLWVS